jgi:hypothetical protein
MPDAPLPPRRTAWGRWITNLLLAANLIVLSALFWRLSQPPRPEPRMVGLAVRATVFALPTATPYVVEVQVTRIVETTRLVPAPTPIAAATSAPPPAATAPAATAPPATEPPAAPSPVPTATTPPAESRSFGAAAAPVAAIAAQFAPTATPEPAPAPAAVVGDASACPARGSYQYTMIPIADRGDGRTDYLHGDLNLSLRGYSPIDVPASLISKNGPVDNDPPQLTGIFADGRLPTFGQSYRVHDWNWNCGEYGCRGEALNHVEATLLTLDSTPGEPIGIPHRSAQIYEGDYKALVLYAEETRITLGYTRDDSVAHGYTVHMENVCVDPNLLAQYRASNGTGRTFLPALREDEILGTAAIGAILVAVRDRGVFFDPRVQSDWWQGH